MLAEIKLIRASLRVCISTTLDIHGVRGGPPVPSLPPFPGDRALLMLSVLALGVKNSWGGSMGEWGVVQGVGHCIHPEPMLLHGGTLCSGAETCWCPIGSGRGCRMASPCSLGAAWGFLVLWHPTGFRGWLEGPFCCLRGEGGGMACDEVWGCLVLKQQLPGRGNVEAHVVVGHGDGTAPGDGVRSQSGSLEREERLCSIGGARGWSWGKPWGLCGDRG